MALSQNVKERMQFELAFGPAPHAKVELLTSLQL